MKTNTLLGWTGPKARAMTLGAMVVLAGLASSAAAQAAHRFDRPINDPAEKSQGRQGAQVHVEMSQSNDDDTYSVTINNGKVTAEHNGKAIPADQIRRRDGKVELLDKDGNVVSTFNVGSGDGRANVVIQGGDDDDDKKLKSFAIGGEKPKVMLGITMADVADSIRDHLKIDPNTAIQLDRVIEGLPASKAGLQEKDIVVEFEGVKPITQEKFREILKKKNPGEKVAVKVLRQGETKDFTIKLEAWDAEKLGMPQDDGVSFAWGDDAQAKKWAEEAMKNAENMRQRGGQWWGDKNSPQWREHMDMLKKLQGEDGQRWLFNLTPDQMQMFTPMDPDASKRVEQRLKKVEDRLDKLADRLDKLATLLEKQQGKGAR